MKIPNNPIYRYFDNFFHPNIVKKLKPLNLESGQDFPEAFSLLPKFGLLEFLFSNKSVENSWNPELFFMLNLIQKSAEEVIPDSTDFYWQHVRRREKFTEYNLPNSLYNPSAYFELESYFREEDFEGFDEILKNKFLRELMKLNLNHEKIDLSSKVNHEQISVVKIPPHGIHRYGFNTEYGFTDSYWDLNSKNPSFIIFDRNKLN